MIPNISGFTAVSTKADGPFVLNVTQMSQITRPFPVLIAMSTAKPPWIQHIKGEPDMYTIAPTVLTATQKFNENFYTLPVYIAQLEPLCPNNGKIGQGHSLIYQCAKYLHQI